jgi:predicted enzyme related to lactoylglutathione lyase
MPMNFNSILIGSADPKQLVDFYTKVLGEPMYADDSYTTWQIGSGSISVGPHSEVQGSNQSPGRLIWNIETTRVREEFERMKGAGATVVAEPYGFEGYPDALVATFADPDGNYFQLMTPMVPEGETNGT